MEGGGLYGHFREKGLPMRVQGCLEGFQRGCADYLSWQFVPKLNSPNGESVLAISGTTPLLVELIGVAA